MEKTKLERLEKKYSGFSSKAGARPQLNPAPGRGGPMASAAMGRRGKPKNALRTIVKLLNYLSGQRVLLICALICALLHTFSSLASSYMLRPIMNKFLYYDPSQIDIAQRLTGLLWGIVAMAVVYAVYIASMWGQQRLMLTVSQRSLKQMRTDLYNKLQTLPVKYFDTNSTGDIMSRFSNDVDAVGEMLNTTLIQIISGAITITGTIVLMLYTNWILGLITIIRTPLLTYASKAILKSGRAAYVEKQKSLGMLNGFAEETISGQKVVKVFNHEETAIEEFCYLNDKLCRSQIKAQFCSGIMGTVTHQLCNVSYGITACVGAILVVVRALI